MVHSEQMLPLGTNPKDDRDAAARRRRRRRAIPVSNTTDLTIRDIGVFRRVDVPGSDGEPLEYAPQIEAAYVPKLDAGVERAAASS